MSCDNPNELPNGNRLVKLIGKVKELNRNYELDHNQDIDAGKMISPINCSRSNSENENEYKENNDTTIHLNEILYINNNKNIRQDENGKLRSHSSLGFERKFEVKEDELNHTSKKFKNGNQVYTYSNYQIIDENLLNTIGLLGYDKDYMKNILASNEKNYASTAYYLLKNSEG
jgi:hypothetical protein